MANSEDNEFCDLDDETPLDDFGKATTYVRSCPGTFSDTDLLYFYSRYKQASDGVCNTSKPGFFDFAGKKKWEAWNSLGEMTVETAKKQYVEKLTELRPDWLPKSGEAPVKGGGGGGMQIRVSKMAVDEHENDKPVSKNACEYAKCGDLELLRAFLANNPREVNLPDSSDEDKLAPLHWACDRGNCEIVSLLLSSPGVDVNVRDSWGQTPLHFASSCDHLDCVNLLLKAPGIDRTITDIDGNTPFYVASSDAIKSALQSS